MRMQVARTHTKGSAWTLDHSLQMAHSKIVKENDPEKGAQMRQSLIMGSHE
jgi:hypothetical protein